MSLVQFDYPLVRCELWSGRVLYTRADEIKECLELPDGAWRLLTPQGAYTLKADPFNLRRLGEEKERGL